MSLRLKLFGAIGATLCVLLGVLVLLAITQEQREVERAREQRRAILEFASGLCSPAELVTSSPLLRADRLHPMVRALAVYPAGGDPAELPTPSGRWGPFDADAELRTRAEQMVETARRTGEAQLHDDSVAVPTRRTDELTGPLRTAPPVVFLEMRFAGPSAPGEAGRATYAVIVAAGAVLLAMAWFLVDRVIARRLGDVVSAAGRVAAGDYSQPVPETGRDDEIERVAAAFNGMMEELDRLHRGMQAQMGDVLAEARRTQDSLVIAQRLAATGRLAAGIAHEVNNPLAGMIEAVRALRTRDLPPAKRDEYLELVEEGLRRIEATVARILQFTPHKVAPRTLTMDEVVRPVLGLARHRVEKLGVAVEVEGSGEAARFFGDPYELQQAVLNVVLNALDAIEDAKRDRPALRLATTADDRDVRLIVSDNGTGIREEDLARVFDLFFTTKDPGKGTGLGLATAHKILTDHGGRLEIRSRPGEGVDVEFVLPRLRE